MNAGLVRKIQELIENCEKIINHYKDAIKQKLSSIYNPVNISPMGLENSVHQLNALLKELGLSRKKFVDAIEQQGEIREKLCLINKKIAHLQIERKYRDYKKQWSERNNAASELQTKKKEVEETSKRLKNLEQEKSDVGLAIKNINNALNYVFFIWWAFYRTEE